jgi:hypothetical protein
MDPDDLIDSDALAEKISAAVSTAVNQNLRGIETNIESKIESKINENFKNLQEPVQQAVTAQFVISAGIAGVFLLFMLYITVAFKGISDRQHKLEQDMGSQREMAHSISIASVPPQSPRTHHPGPSMV